MVISRVLAKIAKTAPIGVEYHIHQVVGTFHTKKAK